MNVLFIEDSDDDRFLLERKLKQDFPSVHAQQVQTEQDLREKLKQSWDLAICDYHLPEFDALQAIQITRQLQPDLPIIVASGIVTEEFAVEVMRAGAQDFIMKDNLARLAPAVKRSLAGTQRRKHIRQMQEKLHLLDRAVESSSDPMIIMDVWEDDKSPLITYCNQAFYALSGYNDRELLGKPATTLSLITQNNLIDVWQRLAMLSTEDQEIREQVSLKTRNGNTVWLSFTITPIRDTIDRITHYVAVGHDITALKEKDEQLTDLNVELADRLLNLRNLHKIQQKIAENAPLSTTLSLILSELENYANVLHAKIILRDESGHFQPLLLTSTAADFDPYTTASIITSDHVLAEHYSSTMPDNPELLYLNLNDLSPEEFGTRQFVKQAQHYYGLPLTNHELKLLGVIELFCDQAILDEDQQLPDHIQGLAAVSMLAMSSQQQHEHLTSLATAYDDLVAFNAAIEQSNDVQELISLGLESLSQQLDFAFAFYTRIEGQRMTLLDCSGDVPDLIRAELLKPQALQGLTKKCVQEDHYILISDYNEAEQSLEKFKSLQLNTALGIPVHSKQKVIGVFTLSSQEQVAISPTHVSIAQSFVARLEHALERVTHIEEISATREATFRALGLALEFRDFETKGHTDNVVELSKRFAAAINLAEQIEGFLWGAYFHDVGKIGIPDSILLKPGKLDAEEWATMKNHTVYGTEMCQDIPFLPLVTKQVVRSHHERWDGSGYPDGLAGEDIPFVARMFSLVDVYDALTSVRPYKKAWTHEETIAEIQRQAGKQFDPELVEVFVGLFDQAASQPSDNQASGALKT